MRIHFQRALVAGLLPIGIALLLAGSRPQPGPGLLASAGLAAAGVLILLGARGLHKEATLCRPARWLVRTSDRWYPPTLIIAQNFFIALMVLQLWFAMAELGLPTTVWLNLQLLVLLVLAPARRILLGSVPLQPSPRREIVAEFIRYTFIALIALFAATFTTRLMFPPGSSPLTGPLPPGLIIVWMAAELVNLGCLILFLDHVLRKMAPAGAEEHKDALD